MNSGHLPAGRAAQGGPPPGVEMGPGPGGGQRRGGRYPSHYHQHQHQHQQHVNHQMYSSYMNSYGNPYGYPPMPPPHFPQNGPMPNGYLPYQPQPQQYMRSPPSMQHYVPMATGGMPQQFSRGPQQSPVVVSSPMAPPPQHQSPVTIPTAYQPPPPPPPRTEAFAAPAPIPPPTPSSTHSSQALPTPQSPALSQTREAPAQPSSSSSSQPADTKPLPAREAFRPPLPWLSRPDVPFPARASRSRRRRRVLAADAEGVELPQNPHEAAAAAARADEQGGDTESPRRDEPGSVSTPKNTLVAPLTAGQAVRSETPSTQGHPSEDATSTSPTSPSSVQPTQTYTAATPAPAKHAKTASRATVPALPIIPAIPRTAAKEAKLPAASGKSVAEEPAAGNQPTQAGDKTAPSATLPAGDGVAGHGEPKAEEAKVEIKAHSPPAPPKSWASLLARPNPVASAATASGGQVGSNGAVVADGPAGNGPNNLGGFAKANSSSMAEALLAYRVDNAEKIAFIEPRGLVNSGNMCYMNSVLQVLIFCVPFYDLLDQASKKAAFSFKSKTPLIDAMINFMREFKAIDSAVSVDQLRRRLKSEELEQFGDPFTPEFVYEAIKQIPRFSSMTRGHQQDAEEFLGFFLDELREECELALGVAPNSSNPSAATNSPLPTATPSVPSATGETSNDWHEVGPRQRAAITRSSGHSSGPSPIKKIFGGQMRSELRVPGLKDSVTLQPYQSIQLDIDSPQVRNITDALRGVTKPETLSGDFNPSRGKDISASKQVFIESLPAVLILHLKRFHFDAQGQYTHKIGKKVGYPLELEIPAEVFSRQKRNRFDAEGAGYPKYRLIAVVYHHGKQANGGHYTVDVLRQDRREWIRLDDTLIRRVRSEDVAEGGAEEEPSKASNTGRKEDGASGPGVGSTNRFAGMSDADAGDSDDGWKQVSTAVNGGKKWSSVVNGGSAAPAPKPKQVKENVKDNKVAYLLFYQRI